MLPDPVGGIGVERRRRLVQQQQLGLVDQRLRQRHARLLPGGKLAVGAVEEIAEIEIGGERLDALAQILDGIEPAEDGEVLPHREPHRHVDIGAFEIHPPSTSALCSGIGAAQHLDPARGRQHQPHDHGDGGGLAGAVAAEQPGNAAARNAERDVVDGAGGLVELDEMRDVDRCGSCRIGRGQRGDAASQPSCGPFIGPSGRQAQDLPQGLTARLAASSHKAGPSALVLPGEFVVAAPHG